MRNLACLMLFALPLAAAAQVYRWVDAQGQVHYTQTPPPGFKAETVAPPSPPTTNPGMDAVRAFNQDAAKSREESARQKSEADARSAQRAAQCQRARQQITRLETRNPNQVVQKAADGSLQRMTPEAHAQGLEQARAAASKSCS